MNILKHIALRSCTVICTIHQPSSQLFFLFDRVIYLKNGQIFHQGLMSNVLNYFTMKGFICPENYNPSDFVMSLCYTLTMDEVKEKGLLMDTLPDSFMATMTTLSSKRYDYTTLDLASDSSFLKQLYLIIIREYQKTTRDIPGLKAKIRITIVLNILFGTIFYQSGNVDNSTMDKFAEHSGAVTLIVLFNLVGAGQGMILSLPYEIPMILREYATGTCKLSNCLLN